MYESLLVDQIAYQIGLTHRQYAGRLQLAALFKLNGGSTLPKNNAAKLVHADLLRERLTA